MAAKRMGGPPPVSRKLAAVGGGALGSPTKSLIGSPEGEEGLEEVNSGDEVEFDGETKPRRKDQGQVGENGTQKQSLRE